MILSKKFITRVLVSFIFLSILTAYSGTQYTQAAAPGSAVNESAVVSARSSDGVWGQPYNGAGTPYVSPAAKYNGQQVQIVREAQTKFGTYEQFTINGKAVGWLDKKAFSSIGQTYYNNTVKNESGVIKAASYDGIWADPYAGGGNTHIAAGTKYNNQLVQIVREAKTTYGIYEQFTLNGKVIGWLDKKAFGVIGQIKSNNALNAVGLIKAASSDSVWITPYLGSGTPFAAKAPKYNGQQVQIVREAQTNYGTYEQFAINGKVTGWLDKKAFSSIGQTYYNNTVKNESGVIKAASYDGIWVNPYAGSGDTFVAAGTKYNSQFVQINREAKTTYGTYEQFTLNGKVIGWLDKKAFSVIGELNSNSVFNAVGSIKAASSDGVWGDPYLGSGTPYVVKASNYNGQLAQIVREAQTNFGAYYQFTVNGRSIGWLDKKAFTSVQNLSDYTEIDLRKPSNITVQDIANFFKQYSPNSLLKADAQSFIDAQNKYGVNAQYLLAQAVWETGWGSSDLYSYKHNLYGYGAYDIAPFTCGYYFPTDSDSINFAASKIINNYLIPNAQYYVAAYGPTLQGMNVHYASDQNWKNGIAAIMQEIKPLDPAYYAKTAEIAAPSVDTATYQTDIPSGKPVPSDTVINFPNGTVGNIVGTSTVNMRSLPYVTSSTLLKSVSALTPVTVLGYNTDVSYDPGSSGNYSYRWYRVSVGGQSGWIYGEYLNIENLFRVTVSGQLAICDSSQTNSKTIASVSNGTYLTPLINNGKPITNNGFYEVYVPGQSTYGWVPATSVLQVKQ